MSTQRIATSHALEILLLSNYFNDDGSDSEIDPIVNAALASVPAVEYCRVRWTRSDSR